MRRSSLLATVALSCLLCPALAFADLKAVKAEPDLQKRSRLALENADIALDRARQAYRKSDGESLDQALAEISESVKLAYQSLLETGKKPRRNARPFKRGEISTRELLRRLDAFQKEMSYVDRDRVSPVIEIVQKVHDDFLTDVMGGRQ